MNKWKCLFLLVMIAESTTRAGSQELIPPVALLQAEKQYVQSLRYFDKFLPGHVKAGNPQQCEYNQYPVTCYEVTSKRATLSAASNRYLASFPKVNSSDIVSFVNTYIRVSQFKKEPIFKLWMIATPHPPFIPFAAYDGQKSHVGDLRSRGDAFVDNPDNFADNEYLKKVDGSNYAADTRFSKEVTVAQALEKSKASGFKFFEREHDDYVGLDAPAFFLSKDIEGGELAQEYWQEFYKRSQERTLQWGDDCSHCSIVRKTTISQNQYILSYCTVEASQGVRGVPQNCMPVLYVQDKETTLRGIATFQYIIGLGGVESGYVLSCKPSGKISQGITWARISDDVSAVLTSYNYVPVKGKNDGQLKFINEFRASKLDPKMNEWTTVSVFGDPDQDGKPVPATGFSLKLDLNFSLRNEVDRTKYRPSSISEEVEGLQTLRAAFRDDYRCNVSR